MTEIPDNLQATLEEEEYGSLKPVGWFRDRKFAEIPCYRNSFMYAILGSCGVGIARFMLTSNLKMATMNSVLAFPLVLVPYYAYCRHKQVSDRCAVSKIRSKLQTYADKQGIELDPEDIRKAALESGLDPQPFLDEYRRKKEALKELAVES